MMSPGLPAPFDPAMISGLSIQDVIDMHAEMRPDAVFLVDPHTGTKTTFLELQARCRRFAARLRQETGCVPGDSIAFAMPNTSGAVSVILGCLYGGYVATAVNLVSGQATISHVLNHSDARVVFVTDQSVDLVKAATAGMESGPRIVVFEDAWVLGAEDSATDIQPTHDALLMYTSGTTGVPKGVLHSHASLLAGGSNTALAHELTSDDRALCVLPLYHINGLCVTLLGTLVSGGSLVLPEKFSVSTFWNHIRNFDCTWFSVVPTQISYLLHHAESNGHSTDGLDALRFGRSASAPLSPEVQQSFETRFGIPVIETMGLTETAAQILSNPMDGPRKIGSPGIPFGNEVIVADDKQQECARGIEGEVLVRGANLMREYRKNPDATSATLTSDGWLRTGDLGRMDDDGFVFITGRLKELIIKGGENIAPREIDEALYAHPDVVEAAAFARECPQYGQRVEAGVMLREESPLTALDLIDLCIERVGRFKAPDAIHVLPELPKGPSGKIQRMKLAELTENIA